MVEPFTGTADQQAMQTVLWSVGIKAATGDRGGYPPVVKNARRLPHSNDGSSRLRSWRTGSKQPIGNLDTRKRAPIRAPLAALARQRERGALAPLFVLITARPEFRPPWSMRAHHAMIAVAPLDRQQVGHMVGELAARHALPKEVVTPRKSKSDSSAGMVAVGPMMISLLALVAAKRRAGHNRS